MTARHSEVRADRVRASARERALECRDHLRKRRVAPRFQEDRAMAMLDFSSFIGSDAITHGAACALAESSPDCGARTFVECGGA